ncbi:MAG: hypothetical protein AAF108_04070 [Planctomycetota bacterium]
MFVMLVVGAACSSGGFAAGQDSLPGLDELLGLEEPASEEPKTTDGGTAAPTDVERALNQALEGEASNDDFVQAVGLMGESAERLSAPDAGETTQRLQEEILRKLDRVIEQAKNSEQPSSSSSSSSSSQQQQQQQPNQQNQSSGQKSSDGESGEQKPPGSGAARPASAVATDRAEWGSLPERVRDALQQGSSSRFSAVYRRLTESYYRRLAEETTK